MPGIRDRNLRSGDIHEDLGQLLLRAVALVAPVPVPEDVGLDAVATLLRPEGGRRLVPEDTFCVQFKASSTRTVSYEDHDAARWLLSLDIPFFIGSVRVQCASIDLFPVHNLFKVRLHPGLKEVHLHLDGSDHPECYDSPEIAHIRIGPPVHSWSSDDLADPGFHAAIYKLLKGHIVAAQRNIQNRVLGYSEPLRWQPGQAPEFSGACLLQRSAGEGASEALTALVAPIRTLISELNSTRQIAFLPAVFEFIKVMRSLGTDPDSGDILMKMAIGGPPDELRKQVFDLLLAQGMSPVRCWWQGKVSLSPDPSPLPQSGAPEPDCGSV